MSGEGKVVCVTGGSGYIASWLVKFLLERGYTVKATVRDPSDPKKTEHLRALDGAKERLCLFKANLLEEGSFDSAIDGCEGVFHPACPLFYTTDPKAELIDPAVKGTLNVLRSCAKVPSLKRVIITSSMASVMFNGKPLTPDVVIDETWFSDPAHCESIKHWYLYAKTIAEKAAWKFAKEIGIDMVTIHPGFVIGPFLQPTLNLTVEVILNYINGETFPNEIYRFVDVRDVASAHIQAFEQPSANGRYCLVERVVHFSELLKIVHEQYPTLHLPEKREDGKPFALKYEISKEKAKSLGINFIPLEVELVDPAVKGTLNVLRSCAKVPSIKRVIVTSSFAAVPYSGNNLAPDVIVDETWFSNPAVCVEQKLWYQLGKTLAEQAAWEFAKDNRMDLVTINPVFVVGPLLQPTINHSVEMLLNLINGAQEYPDAYYRSVDVRDVAHAHIQALEIPSAGGRYCLIERDLHFSEVLKIVHQHYPTLQLPEKSGPGLNYLTKYGISKEKAKTLGIDFIPLEAEQIDPAVKGTLNVLKSCTKVQFVKRVIITSSLATMAFGKPVTPDVVFDETWYSNPKVCKKLKFWYMLAKTLAEEAAWRFAKENSINLVTLNPGYVIGAKTYPDAYYRPIDVQDVAVTHVQALEISSASGRYCLAADDLHFSELLKIIHEHYPTL
ncbi:hypothetical protein GH714_001919 [Hevea brasiliensis]|uniref:NAD-dependent epimerase/dehydratase domain-containing protein n=1 Tax=Hevea brasiliensis TaxID=3981 RepID=A0A6A6KZD6_HEVBR|nr:hypothetical protein GH714_001919 [Hevea brasiliensis]